MNIFKGRINRSTFLLGNVIFGAFAFLLSRPVILDYLEGRKDMVPLVLFAYLVLIVLMIFGLSIYIRRLHDVGLTGWLWPIMILPAVDIVLLVLPGVKRNNKYGLPHKTSFDFKILYQLSKNN